MKLTKQDLNSTKFGGKTIQEHMDESINNSWAYEMFEGWLCQFFDEQSIEPIIYTTYINKQYSILCNEYMEVTNKLSSMVVGSQDWLITLDFLSNLSKDIQTLYSEQRNK